MKRILKTACVLSLGLAALLPENAAAQGWGIPGGFNPSTSANLGVPEWRVLLPDLVIRHVALEREGVWAYALVQNIGTAPSQFTQVTAMNKTGWGHGEVEPLNAGESTWVYIHACSPGATFLGCGLFTGFRVDDPNINVELSESNNSAWVVDNSGC